MKYILKRLIFSIIICLIFSLVFTVSCKKDAEDSPVIIPNVERVTKIVIYEGVNERYKTEFIYESNKIKTEYKYIFSNTGEWENWRMAQYSYEVDNSIVMLNHEWSLDEWHPIGKDILNYNGSSPIEYSTFSYSGGWVPQYRAEWMYQGGLVTKTILYEYEMGNWLESYKNEYEYDGANIIINKGYDYKNGSWELNYRYEVIYQDGKVSELIGYDLEGNDWKKDEKYILSYNGNLISKSMQYWANLSDSLLWYQTNDYEYNENANLISDISTSYIGTIYQDKYFYEPGYGNYRQTTGPIYYLIYSLILPLPVKGKLSVSKSNLYNVNWE